MSRLVALLVTVAASVVALAAGYCYFVWVLGLAWFLPHPVDLASIGKSLLAAISAVLAVGTLSWISPLTRRWHYPLLFVAPCLLFAAGAGAAWSVWALIAAVTFGICLAGVAGVYRLRAHRIVALERTAPSPGAKPRDFRA